MEKVVFILVHGSWHGGWCWKRVAEILRARGHTVFTPTLTGLAERAHLLSDAVDLDTHVADIVDLIDAKRLKDIVLVGHSYGGMPVTAAADRRTDRIRSLFLLDAFVPENGQSLVDVAGHPQPTTPTNPCPRASVFVKNEKDWAWVDSMLTPHPNGTRKQKTRLTGDWLRIAKKTYVRVPAYPMKAFDAALARFRTDRSWRTGEIQDAGHDAMIDQPEQLARMIEEAI